MAPMSSAAQWSSVGPGEVAEQVVNSACPVVVQVLRCAGGIWWLQLRTLCLDGTPR